MPTITLQDTGERHIIVAQEVDWRIVQTRCNIRVAMVGGPCDKSSVYQKATRKDCGVIKKCEKCFG